MSKWSEYYEGRVGNRYSDYCKKRYRPFIDAIKARMNKSVPFVWEEGCGIGTITKVLGEEIPESKVRITSLFDLDKDIVRLAIKNLEPVRHSYDFLYINNILYSQTYSKIDVIHGHGVLEHFEDVEIRTILDRQCKEARHVIHYVPTDGYDEPSFGDERLLPVEYWVKNFKPTTHFTFNDDKDLCLIWDMEDIN